MRANLITSSFGVVATLIAFLLVINNPGQPQLYPHATFLLFVAIFTLRLQKYGASIYLPFSITCFTAFASALFDQVLPAEGLGQIFSVFAWVFYSALLIYLGVLTGKTADRIQHEQSGGQIAG